MTKEEAWLDYMDKIKKAREARDIARKAAEEVDAALKKWKSYDKEAWDQIERLENDRK